MDNVSELRLQFNIFNNILTLQGAGSDWWKHMHYQHHAKPNTVCIYHVANFLQMHIGHIVRPSREANFKKPPIRKYAVSNHPLRELARVPLVTF